MPVFISKDTEVSPIDRTQIENGVTALLEVIKKSRTTDDLLSAPKLISLQIVIHKIPSKKKKQVFIHLPHPLYTYNTEICMFTKDVSKDDIEKSEDFYQQLFEKDIGFVPKIIPLQSLNKDYKSYESKRQLCGSYDLFLTDDRVTRFLPERLGVTFYRAKKMPWDFNLSVTEGSPKHTLKKRFDKTLSKTLWMQSGNGNCSMVTVASTSFSREQIVENVETALKAIGQYVIRGWKNVRAIHIKSQLSLSLPIYETDDVCPDPELDVKDDEEIQYINATKERKSQKGVLAPKVLKRRKMKKKVETRKTKRAKLSDSS